jgi:hypothetical protein
MSNVLSLLARCRKLGAELTPTPRGTLKVSSPTPLPEALREELKRHKPEVLRLLATSSPAWPCPHCGRSAEIEVVERSFDEERMLTFWHCEPCQSYAVTPDTIRQPPKGWSTKTKQ